jgi:hypothetical protein
VQRAGQNNHADNNLLPHISLPGPKRYGR